MRLVSDSHRGDVHRCGGSVGIAQRAHRLPIYSDPVENLDHQTPRRARYGVSRRESRGQGEIARQVDDDVGDVGLRGKAANSTYKSTGTKTAGWISAAHKSHNRR